MWSKITYFVDNLIYTRKRNGCLWAFNQVGSKTLVGEEVPVVQNTSGGLKPAKCHKTPVSYKLQTINSLFDTNHM